MLLRGGRWKTHLARFSRSFCNGYDSQISELNQEMTSVFGDMAAPPPAPPKLNHVGEGGEAEMVDVSGKEETRRRASATCKVLLGREAFELVAANKVAKGDVLTVAKVAGIGGAKQTASLIPLCHVISLSHVDVDLGLCEEDFSVRVAAAAVAEGRTGVEMEAMTAAAVAALTVYDMCKAASKAIQITDLRLESKEGGKSGRWSR
ncbi:cofactor of nitrate reductase and xanthine dehydrogenase 3 isoform X2 [Wolffia australiana]